MDRKASLQRPILYSNWNCETKNCVRVERKELRSQVKDCLKRWYPNEQFVLFDEVLDLVLRIDRVFRQPQGHLLLIGISGAGKTTLSRFVAWLNEMSVCEVHPHPFFKL